MHIADWIVLSLYLVATVGIGIFLGRMVKTSADLFAAGGASPWWASGLSAFMTMFSANTFVVWGGMAYEHGLVAIMVNLCYGVAALLAGYTVAGKWKRLGVRTPAEFVERRFGKGALHFYTWSMMIYRMVGAAGALYAISILTVALTHGDNTAVAVTGMPPELVTAILIFAAVIVLYTMIGGLWAVLMTDVIQFIVLNAAVVFVVVLILLDIGGIGGFIAQAPEGFLAFTSGSRYTWFFLFGWVAIHYFMIGAEFAFVQRYLCVPSPRDARRGTVLFGVLYLFSPFLWLLPPLLWRVQSPIPEGASDELIRALKEEAYIRSCKNVLPIGMIGLMMAAMFSATASMISSQLNVFSGVITHDIYRPLRKVVTDQELIRAGRLFTLLLGALIAVVALCIPMLGGAEKTIISITELMVVPLLAPILMGLLSKKVNVKALWLTAGLCIPLGLALHFQWITSPQGGVGKWLFDQSKTFVGVVLPMGIVLTAHLRARSEDRRWKNIESLQAVEKETQTHSKQGREADTTPAKIVGWSMVVLGLGITALLPINPDQGGIILLFAILIATIGIFILACTKQSHRKPTQ